MRLKRITFTLLPFLSFSLIMFLFNPIEIYFTELSRIKWWLLGLNGLYGFHYNLNYIILRKHTSVGAAGHSSTTSMIACCTHHFVDIIPLVGATALSSFIVYFQTDLFILALSINMISIVSLFKKHNYEIFETKFMTTIFSINFKVIATLFSITLLSIFLFTR